MGQSRDIWTKPINTGTGRSKLQYPPGVPRAEMEDGVYPLAHTLVKCSTKTNNAPRGTKPAGGQPTCLQGTLIRCESKAMQDSFQERGCGTVSLQ